MNEKKTLLDPKKEVKVGVVILNVDEVIKNEIKKFDEAVTEDKIVAAVEGYRGLEIMGVDDKDGYDAVHQARIVLKNMRIAVDTRRKELKADFLRVGNAIEAQAKHLIGILEPTEKYLAAQEKAVDDEVERLKKEAKEKVEKERRDRIEGRVASLREIGFIWGKDAFYYFDGDNPITMTEIEELSDDDFNAFHFKHKARYSEWLLAEEKRKAEETRAKAEQEALRRAESERLAKERAELETLAKARKLEEEQLAKQRTEQERILAEEMKKERERALAEQKKLDEEREKFRIEKENLERQRKELEDKKSQIDTYAVIKDIAVAKFQEERGVLAEKILAVDPASEVQTVHSGIVPVVGTVTDGKVEFQISPLFESVIESIKTNLSKSQYSNRTSDAEFNKIIESVNILIEKTLTYFDKEVEKWHQSKKQESNS